MGSGSKIFLSTALIAVTVIQAGAALAGAPTNLTQALSRNFPPQRSFPTQPSRPAVEPRAPRTVSGPLDLRPPAHGIEFGDRAVFPSAMIHRQLGGSEESSQLPALSAQNAHIRPPLEVMARRIHSEGLPVARLWENKSALVHIGLNQRGKPGLWLVQKTH
jgi:hypothetical protein